MSITGTQAVSMPELTALGLDRLNAMAQGQQPSIAPSYLVLAAIEQLKKGKAGEQTPMPQGTVKDRLLASINQPQPMQAGIAQMQPAATQPTQPQKFAGGGLAKGSGIQYADSYIGPDGKPNPDAYLLPTTTGYEGMSIPELLSSLYGSAKNKLSDIGDAVSAFDDRAKKFARSDVPGYYPPTATSATRPTYNFPDTAGAGRGVEHPAFVSPVDADVPIPPDTTIAASASQRGVGGMGNSPLAKYATLGPQKQASDFPLDVPKNAQLAAAAAKFAQPDAARMAELKTAENRAGLGAFARGMVNPDRGRGFGAVFGSAVADANDASEKRADARREYEDKREQLATNLGIALGDEAKQKYLTESQWGATRAKEANELAVQALLANNQTSHFQNEDATQRIHALAAQQQASAMMASRADALAEASRQHQVQLSEAAYQRATQYAESVLGKTDPVSGQYIDPDKPAQKQAIIEREFNRNMKLLSSVYAGSRNAGGLGTYMQGQAGAPAGEAKDYTKP